MNIPILRPYQESLVADARLAMRHHRRVLAVAPTGSGKTVTFAFIVQSAQRRGKRVVITAHRSEIVDQISAALASFGVSHGIVAPGRPGSGWPVQVAMIQTLARRLDAVAEPDLLVVDEAHHAVAGTWQAVAAKWTKARILGVTATPIRTDGRGLRDAFDVMVLGPTIDDLVGAGHLAAFEHLAPHASIDMGGIHVRHGDFDAGQIVSMLNRKEIIGDVVSYYRDHLAGAPAVAFCPTVEFSQTVAGWFTDAGFRSVSVDASLQPTERARRVQGLVNGSVQVLTSCDLISEGFDVPSVAGAILLRPTMSLALYLQQVGRCLRPKADNGRALILDHVGNVHRHGLVNGAREWSLDGQSDCAAEVKTCGKCHRVFDAKDAARSAASACDKRCLPAADAIRQRG